MADLQKSASISSWCFWIDRFRGQYIGVSFYSELASPPFADNIENKIASFMQNCPSSSAIPQYDEGLFMHFTPNQVVANNYQYTEEEIAEKTNCLSCNTAPLVPLIAESYAYMDKFAYELSLELAFERTNLLVVAIANISGNTAKQVALDLITLYFRHFKFDTNGYLFYRYLNEADLAYNAIKSTLKSIVSGNYSDKTLASKWQDAMVCLFQSHNGSPIALGLNAFRIITMGYGQNIISGFNILHWISSIYSQTIRKPLQNKQQCNYQLN